MEPLIALTSDFGPGPFVGIMKGVILGLCPQARLVDLCHDIPPQDVRAGALALEQALEIFPPGTVHLAVVDPGVGTSRRGLALRGLGRYWVGPDNGLFTPVLEADPQAQAWELAEASYFRQPVSRTFHGRDIFAPVAARLALGLEPGRLGPSLAAPVRLSWPRPRLEEGRLLGQVLAADRFGNLTTNLDQARVEAFLAGRPALVRLEGLEGLSLRGLRQAYGQVPPGEPVALFNSLGRLELALNRGDLRARLGLGQEPVWGLAVVVEPLD